MVSRAAVLLVALGVAVGCGRLPLIGRGTIPWEFSDTEEYRIHPNDQLEITVWGQSDLTRTLRVREDGTFSFPFLGDVVAQQRTLRELEQLMIFGLSQGYLLNPQVTVKLVGQRFSILGEVVRPGTYPLEGRVDLLVALSLAGGLNEFASSRLEIIRILSDGRKASYRVDVNAILSGRHPTVLIHPHDTIHVGRRVF